MTTYSIERDAFPCRAALAERIRELVADFYAVEVTEAGALLYSVDAVSGSTLGNTCYWLKDARGRTVGAIVDVNALVRYAGTVMPQSNGVARG